MIKNIILMVILTALLSGCWICPSEIWKKAEKVCDANGGVDYVVNGIINYSAFCVNGAMFEL